MICSGVSRALATLSSLTCAKCTSSTCGTGARTAGPSGLVGAQRLGRERGMQRGYACMCVAFKKFLPSWNNFPLFSFRCVHCTNIDCPNFHLFFTSRFFVHVVTFVYVRTFVTRFVSFWCERKESAGIRREFGIRTCPGKRGFVVHE